MKIANKKKSLLNKYKYLPFLLYCAIFVEHLRIFVTFRFLTCSINNKSTISIYMKYYDIYVRDYHSTCKNINKYCCILVHTKKKKEKILLFIKFVTYKSFNIILDKIYMRRTFVYY